MHKPFHIVLTTIRVPMVLNEYYDNFRRFDRLDSVKVWVVGDVNTPPQAAHLAGELSRRGLETVYLDIASQDEWGKRFPSFYARLPYHNETRRNIGYLRALEDGCEVLISIDDDNYPQEADFIAGHARTGCGRSGPMIRTGTGFYNVCQHLRLDCDRHVYPRGFPLKLRNGSVDEMIRIDVDREVKVGVNIGLWTGAPDLDALTWLNGPVESLAYTGDDVCLLDQNTWTPVSGQNVSVARELIPGFLCVPMGHKVPGGRIERYGDIWGGYFLQAVMRGAGFHVSFGRPVVEHRRNSHHYPDDLRREYWGMMLTDWLVDILKTGFVPGRTEIAGRTLDLAVFLEKEALPLLPSWCPEEMKSFLKETAGSLSAWVGACREAMG